jgi:hypothetical protein
MDSLPNLSLRRRRLWRAVRRPQPLRRLEAVVTAPQQEPATAEARPEAVAVVQQEPALAGSSQATAVEIPDDDTRRLDGTSGQACPRRLPRPRRGRSSDGGTATW